MSDLSTTPAGGPDDLLALRHRQALLEDRIAIIELCGIYCDVVDARDFAGLASRIYAEDAVQVFVMGGQEHEWHGAEEIARNYAAGLKRWVWTAHVLGQTRVTVAADEATCDSVTTAYHWREAPDGDPLRPADWIAVGTMRDELRRGPHGWRVTRRRLENRGGTTAVGGFRAFDFSAAEAP